MQYRQYVEPYSLTSAELGCTGKLSVWPRLAPWLWPSYSVEYTLGTVRNIWEGLGLVMYQWWTGFYHVLFVGDLVSDVHLSVYQLNSLLQSFSSPSLMFFRSYP